MDIFKDLRSKNNNYSEKIEVNKFTQSISEKKVEPVKESSKKYDDDVVKTFKTIFELILSIKDVNYTLLEIQELHKYISDKKLELCSIVDTEYLNLNFNKRILSKSLICKNLQQLNFWERWKIYIIAIKGKKIYANKTHIFFLSYKINLHLL